MPEWETITYANPEALATGVAEVLREEAKPNAVWCLASGGSPEQSYRKFAATAPAEMQQLRLVLLDEWLGLAADSANSCRNFIRELLVEPLGIAEEDFLCFDTTGDAELELQRVGGLLKQFQPLDLCVLGLGRNGHIGFNEPGATLPLHLHVSELSSASLQHAMVFEMAEKPRFGISLGIRDILSAHRILLLVQGEQKAEVYQRFLEAELDPQLPASFLKLHPNLQIHVDRSSIEGLGN